MLLLSSIILIAIILLKEQSKGVQNFEVTDLGNSSSSEEVLKQTPSSSHLINPIIYHTINETAAETPYSFIHSFGAFLLKANLS